MRVNFINLDAMQSPNSNLFGRQNSLEDLYIGGNNQNNFNLINLNNINFNMMISSNPNPNQLNKQTNNRTQSLSIQQIMDINQSKNNYTHS